MCPPNSRLNSRELGIFPVYFPGIGNRADFVRGAALGRKPVASQVKGKTVTVLASLNNAQPSTKVFMCVAISMREVESRNELAIDDHAQASAGAAPGVQRVKVEFFGAGDAGPDE